ncbi:MAG: DUF2304 domain-containing protein [Pirellulaceae bacterium]|jgi:hypothetical protein|nr:DUF2304 domain-containing protein [Pirellulaceae bacterium]MDP7019662.1 DUF2304 domain-containing protein [Pirellulaceae bacterium]
MTTPFQVVSITFLSVLAAREIGNVIRGKRPLGRLFRASVWLTAAVAIAVPQWVSMIASSTGIRRGADLVAYVMALSFVGATFYFYAKCLRLSRQITALTRHLALKDPQFGGGEEP